MGPLDLHHPSTAECVAQLHGVASLLRMDATAVEWPPADALRVVDTLTVEWGFPRERCTSWTMSGAIGCCVLDCNTFTLWRSTGGLGVGWQWRNIDGESRVHALDISAFGDAALERLAHGLETTAKMLTLLADASARLPTSPRCIETPPENEPLTQADIPTPDIAFASRQDESPLKPPAGVDADAASPSVAPCAPPQTQ